MSKHVGIIGAGLSSLYAACYLAKNGHKVTIHETHDQPGGRSRHFTSQGFHFDMGPSWYWMPELIDQLISELGYDRQKFYNIKRLDPSYRVFWKNNEYSDVPVDTRELMQLFDSLEENGGRKLQHFLNDAKVKYDIATRDFLENSGLKISELFSRKAMIASFKLNVFKSIEKDIHTRFNSHKARTILKFPSLFLGEMPSNIPSLYSLMNHADLMLGTWYPEGGMQDLAFALESIAIDLGVTINYNDSVRQIQSLNGRASGIICASGLYEYDNIISGADYNFTEQQLIPKAYRRYDKDYWNRRKMAPSALIYYLGVNKKLPNLIHHNLFFDEDLDAHGRTIYKDHQWPERPLFYVCAPSKSDPKLAPEKHENLFVLVPISTEIEDTEQIRRIYLDRIIDRLEARIDENVRDHIVFQRSYSISEFKTDYNSYKGNAYGLANTLKQTANFKPKMKSKLEGLYFCGQLTVPGPGIPPSLISGKIAAKQIMNR